MSSVTGSRGRELRELARVIAKKNNIVSTFLEGHGADAVLNDVHLGEGNLLLYDGMVVFCSEKFRFFQKVMDVAQVRVKIATLEHLVLTVYDDLAGVMDLELSDMDRPDEVGRIVHFLYCRHAGNLDDRIVAALENIPINGVYARALARYPQHHHDLWNIFGIHTVLQMPDGRAAPLPELPGDAALEINGVDAVLGYHTFWGLEIHQLNQEAIFHGDFDDGVITGAEEVEMACYITTDALCISGPTDPLPLKLEHKCILSIVEYVLTSGIQVPGIRISYISDDGVFNSFTLYQFENERLFETCLHEVTLAWAQSHNRNYNIGEIFPLLDNADLLNIVYHFRQLDKKGYGLIPKQDLVQALAPLELVADAGDVLYEMFDHRPAVDERPSYSQFSKYLIAMRTLMCGSMEDKSDLLFRMLDYQRQGWFSRSEFAWVVRVMARSVGAYTVREGYTLQDFTSWLFGVMDKDGDGYVTWEEAVYSLQEDPTVRDAWTSLGLAPAKEREHKIMRRVGARFVHAGHPQFALCCALQHGIEVASTAVPVEEDAEQPFADVLRFDVERAQQITSFEDDWTQQEEDPEWTEAFPLGSRVAIINMQVDRSFNGKEGIVIGFDIPQNLVMVHLFDAGCGYRMRVANIKLLQAPVRYTQVVQLPPGADPGICFQQKPTKLLFIAGVMPGSYADKANLIPGYIVERIDGSRMHSKEMVDDYIRAWRVSNNNRMVFDLVAPLIPDEQGYECGTRVELTGLKSLPMYNGLQGVIIQKDELDNVRVLLDTMPDAKVVKAYNVIPARTSIKKKYRLVVPPGGSFGIEFDSKPGYPVFIRSVSPYGPADMAHLPVGSVVSSVNGMPTPSILRTQRAVTQWKESGAADCVVEVIVLDTAKTLPHPDKPMPGERSVVTEYAPRVFQQIREVLEVSRDEYLLSVGLRAAKASLWSAHLRSLVEVQPNSMWFTTADEKFTINGLRKEQVDSLSNLLPEYYDYIKTHEDTLLAKYVGVYSILWKGQDTYFSVKQNIFPVPHQRVSKVYVVDPVDEEAFKAEIRLSPVAQKMICDQFTEDARLLASIGSIGYSLVIGVHSVYSEVEGDGIRSGADVRVDHAHQMLLGNPCFSSADVVKSYGITRPLAPVFKRNHHAPLLRPEERPEEQQRAREARLQMFPHLADEEDFGEFSDETVEASDSDAPLTDSDAENAEDEKDFEDEELLKLYEDLLAADDALAEAQDAKREKKKEHDKLAKEAEPYEVRALKRKLDEHVKSTTAAEEELAKLQKKKKKTKASEKREEELKTKLTQSSVVKETMEDELKAARAAARPEGMDAAEKALEESTAVEEAAQAAVNECRDKIADHKKSRHARSDGELNLVGEEKEDMMNELVVMMKNVEEPGDEALGLLEDITQIDKNLEKLQKDHDGLKAECDKKRQKILDKKAKVDEKLAKAKATLEPLEAQAGGKPPTDKELKKKLTKAKKDVDKQQAAVDKLEADLKADEEKTAESMQQMKDLVDDAKFEKEKAVASLLTVLGDKQTEDMLEIKGLLREKALRWNELNKELIYYEEGHNYAQLIKDKKEAKEREEREAEEARIAAELAPLDGKPPDGWRCVHCGNHNAWQVTKKTELNPACARCYRDYDRACSDAGRVSTPPPEHDLIMRHVDPEASPARARPPIISPGVVRAGRRGSMPARGGDVDGYAPGIVAPMPPQRTAAASPRARDPADPDVYFSPVPPGEDDEETEEEVEPSSTIESEEDSDFARYEDPFSSAAAPGPPLASQFAKQPPNIPVQPGPGSPARGVFQKFYGGVPGRLIPPGDVRSYTRGGVDTEIFHFGITDILTTQTPELGAEYAEDFMAMIERIFI